MSQLTPETLGHVLTGAAIRRFTPTATGFEVDVDMRRQTDYEALADIDGALASLGFATAQAVITEWATSAVEASILGTAGGGMAGSSTKTAAGTILGAAIGLVVGAAVGSALRTIKAAYQADRAHPCASWQITQLQPDPVQRWRQPYPAT